MRFAFLLGLAAAAAGCYRTVAGTPYVTAVRADDQGRVVAVDYCEPLYTYRYARGGEVVSSIKDGRCWEARPLGQADTAAAGAPRAPPPSATP